ncbi:hypothetical protein GIHI108528_07965 [Gillisia hiemivivida]
MRDLNTFFSDTSEKAFLLYNKILASVSKSARIKESLFRPYTLTN